MGRLTPLAAILASTLTGALALAHDDGTLVPGQITLLTQPGVTLEDVRAAHPGLTLTNLRNYTPPQIYLVGVPVGQEEAYEAELGADRTLVRAAEENRTVSSPEQGTTQSLFLRSSQAQYLAQGTLLDLHATGLARASSAPGTLVAVLDTGIAPHPDLAGRIVPGGYDFVLDAPDSDESLCPPAAGLIGHGTYVAGLIALTDPDARLLPITVLGCDGIGNAFAVACGIYQAIQEGAGVINMSFATTLASDVVEIAVHDAAAAGITCVSSVSNAARDTGVTRSYPADYEWVVGVGSVEHAADGWTRSPYSDWGRSLRITAPGTNVTSLRYDGRQFGYADGSGTSYSAAWVSGVCSLMHAKFGPRSNEWTASRLCDTATDLAIGGDIGMGCGHRNDGLAALIDARRAVCPADFNADGFLDFFDYDDYVRCFETGDCPADTSADINLDGFADFFDYDDFLAEFETGC